jgi:predicted small metal-binding protein
MTRELNCSDIGFECDAVVRADSDEEIMAQVASHAREVHGLEEIDDETEAKVRSQIHDAA